MPFHIVLAYFNSWIQPLYGPPRMDALDTQTAETLVLREPQTEHGASLISFRTWGTKYNVWPTKLSDAITRTQCLPMLSCGTGSKTAILFTLAYLMRSFFLPNITK